MNETDLRRLAADLDRRGLEWELFAHDGTSHTVEVRGGEVETLKTSRNTGVALRLRNAGRFGFSFSTDPSRAALSRMIDQAVAAAAAMPENPDAAFCRDARPAPTTDLAPTATPLTTEDRIELAMRVERAAMAADPRVARVRKATFAEGRGDEWLANSHGLWRTAGAAHASVSVLAIAEAAGESQTGGDFAFMRAWPGLNPEEVGRSAGLRAARSLGGSPLPTGLVTAIFERETTAELLAVLAPAFLAESVERNRSLLAGKIDEAIMAPCIDLDDDALDPAGAASFPFDGEGTPHQVTPLVKKGRLVGFLHDIETGHRAGRPSTGNAGRGLKSPPRPAPSNLRLSPGTGSLEQLCEAAGDGFLITELIGVHTANPVTGDFSVGASGFEIRGGRLGKPIRGVAVADNALDLFRRVAMVAGDFKYHGSMGTASLLVPGVSISGG